MDAELKKKRTFKKFTYRGVDLDKLLDMSPKDLMELVDVCLFAWFDWLGSCSSQIPSWFEEKAYGSVEASSQGCIYFVFVCTSFRRLLLLRTSVLKL